MATNAARTMSSLLQQDISIITSSNMRYEGKLYTYDTAKATVTLQDARCMGSEDRQTTVGYIPPKDEVYKHVTFTASRIRSFLPILDENAVEDPAIVSYVSQATGGRGSPRNSAMSSTSKAESAIMKLLDADNQRVRPINMSNLMRRNEAGRANAARGGQRSQTGNMQRGKQTQGSMRSGNKGGNSRNQQQQQQQNQRGGRNKKGGNAQANNPKSERRVSFKTDSNQENRPSSDRRQYQHIPQIPKNLLGRMFGGKDAAGRRGTGQDGNTSGSPRRERSGSEPGRFVKPKTTVKFDKEFDFDRALEEFKELSVKSNENKADEEAKKSADQSKGTEGSSTNKETPSSSENAGKSSEPYNREKSFYDNLTTTTDTEPRLSRRDAMLANKETFGTSYVPGRRGSFGGRRSSSVHGQRYSAGTSNFNRAGNGNAQRSQQGGSRNRYTQRNFTRYFRRMVAAH